MDSNELLMKLKLAHLANQNANDIIDEKEGKIEQLRKALKTINGYVIEAENKRHDMEFDILIQEIKEVIEQTLKGI